MLGRDRRGSVPIPVPQARCAERASLLVFHVNPQFWTRENVGHCTITFELCFVGL